MYVDEGRNLCSESNQFDFEQSLFNKSVELLAIHKDIVY